MTVKVSKRKIPVWAAGGVVMLVVMAAYLLDWSPLRRLEYLTYDMRSSIGQKTVTSPVVIIGIDEATLDKLGKWPLSRAYMADMVRKLSGYGAKTVGFGIIYSKPEAENDKGLGVIKEIRGKIDPSAQKDPRIHEIYKALVEAERSLNTDPAFSEALETSKNVILPISFNLSEKSVVDDKKPQAADYLMKNSIKADAKGAFLTARGASQPIREFVDRAQALGHINIVPDGDGVVRSEPVLIRFKDRLFPSFAFQLALSYKGYGISDVVSNDGIKAKTLTIPVDEKGKMQISYAGKASGAVNYSFIDVMADKIPGGSFKDKIVLIGLAGTGRGAVSATPFGGNINNLEITAASVENILNSNHIVHPWWLKYAELFIMLVFWDIVSFLIPRFKASKGAAVAGGVLIAWTAACVSLFLFFGISVKMTYPMLILIVGYLVTAPMLSIETEDEQKAGDIESDERKKMLGLSLHGQGQLDAAFEKFKECRLEGDSIKELLYNLGQEFEGKGMPGKAQTVYEYLLTSGDYKGLSEKIKKRKAAGDKIVQPPQRQEEEATIVMGGSSAGQSTLGRYEVLKELGRGAMGVVFLGRDPKINREVAIKTLSYDDIDSEQVVEVKTRFFREAEAAGKLSHPNIVRVYDVGEDKNSAYMAMELLEGTDLARYCSKDSKLPFGEVLRVVTLVGEALDYAHQNGVVHRDIKPANIMLLKNKELRVTDFGIARVMESSKTQTGMVLGTPSYMSPEQIAGRKVDGRSDLFSLGVVFFELLVCERPFKGDTIATLMYNITSTPPTQIKKIEPRIPTCVVEIIDKLLQKNAEDRYSRGKDLIDALNKCKKTLIKRPAPPAAA